MLAGNGQRWREETGQGTFALFFFFLFFFFVSCTLLLTTAFASVPSGAAHSLPIKQPQNGGLSLSCDSRTLGSFTSFLMHPASGSAPRWWSFPGELAAALFEKLEKIVPSGETSWGLLRRSPAREPNCF